GPSRVGQDGAADVGWTPLGAGQAPLHDPGNSGRQDSRCVPRAGIAGTTRVPCPAGRASLVSGVCGVFGSGARTRGSHGDPGRGGGPELWDRHEPRPTSIAAPRTLEAPRAPSVPLNSNRPESFGRLRSNRPHYFP